MSAKIIPIVLISDANFLVPTSVAMTSIVENKDKDIFIDFFIIMPTLDNEFERRVRGLESKENCLIHFLQSSLDKYDGIKQLAHIPLSCLLKFEVSDLVYQYDKILYMDGDIIVRGDLWNLYDIDITNYYAAGVKDFSGLLNDTGDINAGIMLLNAKRIREEKLMSVFVDTRKGLGDRMSMDQTTFNIVFNKQYKYLDIKYNCVPEKLEKLKKNNVSIDIINKLFNTSYKSLDDIYTSAVIVHYASGRKPWKYTYIDEAKEWYQYYLVSPYNDIKFKLRGKMSFRINKYYQLFMTKGIGVVGKEIKESVVKRFKNGK